jgi:hypothetical protein
MIHVRSSPFFLKEWSSLLRLDKSRSCLCISRSSALVQNCRVRRCIKPFRSLARRLPHLSDSACPNENAYINAPRAPFPPPGLPPSKNWSRLLAWAELRNQTHTPDEQGDRRDETRRGHAGANRYGSSGGGRPRWRTATTSTTSPSEAAAAAWDLNPPPFLSSFRVRLVIGGLCSQDLVLPLVAINFVAAGFRVPIGFGIGGFRWLGAALDLVEMTR